MLRISRFNLSEKIRFGLLVIAHDWVSLAAVGLAQRAEDANTPTAITQAASDL